MESNLCESLIGTLSIELTINTIKNRGFLYITDNDTVVFTGGDWRQVVAPLWISNDFVGAMKVDRSTDDALFGRVNIFRVKDLTWQAENPGFDEHRAVAHVEFLLPGGSEIADGRLFADYVTTKDEFAGPLLNDLSTQTMAGLL